MNINIHKLAPAGPAASDLASPSPATAQGGVVTAVLRALRGLSQAPRTAASRQPPLRLRLDGRRLTFHSIADLDFCLSSRTQIPAEKLSALMQRPAGSLREEAASIREVEHRLSAALAASFWQKDVLGKLFGETEPAVFSQDHSWRDIARELGRTGSSYDGYKRTALAKYLQYLSARHAVVRSLYLSKCEFPPADVPNGLHPLPEGSPLLQTALVEAEVAEPPDSAPLQQLVRGETVSVQIPTDGRLDLHLARHRFELVRGSTTVLRDGTGNEYVLEDGCNLVGRHPGCHAVVNSALRGVSRKHLIVELTGSGRVLLTDLSSLGTFLPVGAAATA